MDTKLKTICNWASVIEHLTKLQLYMKVVGNNWNMGILVNMLR